jgi:hypothetical protein
MGGNVRQPKSKSVIRSEHLKFSFRGFSAKRLAYLLVGVQLWLFYLIFQDAYYEACGGIVGVSLALMFASLLLGSSCPRNDKGRFFPFAMAFLIWTMTALCVPL